MYAFWVCKPVKCGTFAGEVGRDMYIVSRGRLQVVADNAKTILATLRPGSYFGEISILNMGTTGNRRTASVRSVGYSDLFCLNKEDLWDVLKDYPTARVRLEAIAQKRLAKYNKPPLEQGKFGIDTQGRYCFFICTHGYHGLFIPNNKVCHALHILGVVKIWGQTNQ